MPALSITPNLEATPWEDLRLLREQGKLITAMGDEGGTIRIGGLPRGMMSGKASVTIAVPLPDGMVIVTETSLRLFLTAARALRMTYEHECGDLLL